MTTLLSFIFVLGVVVFVHELGHFLVARWHGIRVLTFSLGFGPKVFTVRRGDTDYCLSAIPLGGYVKMAGENPDDPRTGRQDEFLSKGKWQRFQVLVAGATMNVLLSRRSASPLPTSGVHDRHVLLWTWRSLQFHTNRYPLALTRKFGGFEHGPAVYCH